MRVCMGKKRNTILFEDDELDDFKKDDQHDEVMALLQQLIDSSKDGDKWKEIAKAISGNATQLSRFVEAFKAIRIEVPAAQVNVGAPNVQVDVKQEEVILAIGGMFDKMNANLNGVENAYKQLSQDVQAMNESYRADKVMRVSWHSGMVDEITVRIKK